MALSRKQRASPMAQSEGVLDVGLSCLPLTSGLHGQLVGVSLFFKNDLSWKGFCLFKQGHRPLCGSWHLAFTRVLCLSKNPIGIVWKVLFWTWLLLYLIVPRGRHAIRGNRECPWTRWSCLGYRIQSAYNLHLHLIYAHCDTPKL